MQNSVLDAVFDPVTVIEGGRRRLLSVRPRGGTAPLGRRLLQGPAVNNVPTLPPGLQGAVFRPRPGFSSASHFLRNGTSFFHISPCGHRLSRLQALSCGRPRAHRSIDLQWNSPMPGWKFLGHVRAVRGIDMLRALRKESGVQMRQLRGRPRRRPCPRWHRRRWIHRKVPRRCRSARTGHMGRPFPAASSLVLTSPWSSRHATSIKFIIVQISGLCRIYAHPCLVHAAQYIALNGSFLRRDKALTMKQSLCHARLFPLPCQLTNCLHSGSRGTGREGVRIPPSISSAAERQAGVFAWYYLRRRFT